MRNITELNREELQETYDYEINNGHLSFSPPN